MWRKARLRLSASSRSNMSGRRNPATAVTREKMAMSPRGAGIPMTTRAAAARLGTRSPATAPRSLSNVPFRCAPDQLEFLVVAFGVVAERFDQASCRAADPVELVARCRCRRVDGDARPSESGEDRVDARRPGGERSPREQHAEPDTGAEQDHDHGRHVSAPMLVGPPARAVNRSGSSMSAMRVRSQPPAAKMPPTIASMTWPPALS